MSNQVTFDPAANVDIHFRKNRNGNKLFRFFNTSGVAYDISSITFFIRVKAASGKSDNIILKSIGSGLTRTSNNEISVSFTEIETNLKEKEYYWEFFNDTDKTTWLCGDFIIYTGEHQPIDTELDVTVNTNPDTIEITISNNAANISGMGDVVGPAGATDSNFAAFNGITGKLIEDSGVSLASILALSQLQPTSLKTSANSPYSVLPWQYVPFDTTSGAITATLPTAPADNTAVALKRVAGATNNVTYNCGGSDRLNTTGGATSGTLSLVGHQVTLIYDAGLAIWYVETSLSLTSLDGRFQPLDSDLTTIAGLIPSADDVLQFKSGVWANRTLAQYAQDLEISQQLTFIADTSLGSLWTNMPAASTEFQNAVTFRQKIDLSKYRQARMILSRITVAGAAGSGIYLKYSTDNNTYIAIGNEATTNLALLTSTGGPITSSWIDLPAGAKGDVFIAPYGILGDGVADPVIWGLHAEFRT